MEYDRGGQNIIFYQMHWVYWGLLHPCMQSSTSNGCARRFDMWRTPRTVYILSQNCRIFLFYCCKGWHWFLWFYDFAAPPIFKILVSSVYRDMWISFQLDFLNWVSSQAHVNDVLELLLMFVQHWHTKFFPFHCFGDGSVRAPHSQTHSKPSVSFKFIYLFNPVGPIKSRGRPGQGSQQNKWMNKQAKKVAETQRKTKYNSQALEIALRENYLWDKHTKTIWGSDVQAGKLKRQHPVVSVPKSFILEFNRVNNVSSLDLSHCSRNSWLKVQTAAKPFYPVSPFFLIIPWPPLHTMTALFGRSARNCDILLLFLFFLYLRQPLFTFSIIKAYTREGRKEGRFINLSTVAQSTFYH